MNTLDLGSWIILRMNSGDTLRLVDGLRAIGIEAWTPEERTFSRLPRRKARRERRAALTPSYAFGHVRAVEVIRKLAELPTGDLPAFSILQNADRTGFKLIADSELAALRDEESRLTSIFERLKRKSRAAPVFAPGAELRMPDGPFAGLSGVVEGTQGQDTLIRIPGFHKPLRVASCLFIENVASGGMPMDGRAARAA